ncbi:MAG: SDR family oxidoreductase [Rhodocyclaceae bacterium]
MSFTIIGASGFIGGALAARLRAQGNEVFTPARGSRELLKRPLGHVVYAAGVTADFRSRPYDTLRAHTTLLAELLEHADFSSMLYLSSARIYRHAEHGREDAGILVRSEDPEDFYDLTKLTGEALCHASKRTQVRVARLTNVVGPDFDSPNFLVDLIRAACDNGRIELRSAPGSAKDYVLLDDVLDMLPRIALEGRELCYNLGGGRNLSHAALLAPILDITGARLDVLDGAPRIAAPTVDIGRLRRDFGYLPRDVLPRIAELVHQYRKRAHAQD